MSENPSTPPELSSREDTPPDSLLARLRKITGQREAELPPPPPESSAPSPAPVERLFVWLREITSRTAVESPPPAPSEPPTPSAPPVDRLIVWLREAAGVLMACLVAAGIMLAIATIWLGTTVFSGIRLARGWLQRRMKLRQERAAERKAAEEARAAMQASAPVFDPAAKPGEAGPQLEKQIEEPPAPVPEVALEPEKESENLWTPPPQSQPEGPRAGLAWFGPATAPVCPVPAPVPVSDDSEISPAWISPLPLAPAEPKPRRRRRALLAGVLVLAAAPALLLVPVIRYSLTNYLGWGNASVVAGSDGWLFPRPVSSPAQPALRDTVTALRAGGATVVVVSIPSKASVYPEKLDASAGGNLQRHPNITAAHKDLTEAGAQLFDLGPVLHSLKASDSAGESVFRAHSSHWSPRAVEKSAAAAAAFIQQQSGYAALPLRPVSVELSRASIAKPVDDLAAAFSSRRWHDAHSPQPLHFIRLLTADKKPITSDAASPVLLIGGDDARLYDTPSLTNPPESVPAGESLSAGFTQYLSMYLSTSLELQTRDNSLAAAKDWLASKPEADRKSKRFVLWLLADEELLR